MFIQRIYKKTKKKTYSSVVLMENYREDEKVKHHIISNLSKWPKRIVLGLERPIKGQEIKTVNDLGLTLGALYTNQEQILDRLELKLKNNTIGR